MTPAPDYGRATVEMRGYRWWVDVEDGELASFNSQSDARRVAALWDALRGIADPEAFVKAADACGEALALAVAALGDEKEGHPVRISEAGNEKISEALQSFIAYRASRGTPRQGEGTK